MDNPQHYQPLSHALHPPPQAPAQPSYINPTSMYNPKQTTAVSNEREEEEEEEDDDDEGLVEEQLSRNEPEVQGSSSSSPQGKTIGTADARTTQVPQTSDAASQEPDRKRRPGRPRGSKNRKPRVGQTTGKQEFYSPGHPSLHATPPQHPDVNAHNQQYYEFQWRVLNLCAEFYGAAEELVKGTAPLVIAQCYQMGPGNAVDPLTMLAEAKRICDTLLANPSQLISAPPPPIYPVMPIYKTTQQPQPAVPAPAPTNATASNSKTATPSNMISNPQSFVVSLGAPQAAYTHAQYPMYPPPPPGQYTTTPYYHQYAYPHQPTYYPQAQAQPVTQPHIATATPQAQVTPQPQSQVPQASTSAAPAVPAPANVASTSASATGAGANQGAWSEDETERLKKLAEDSKSIGSSGEIEWDWVVHEWGNGRTRHQILIKATSLGLKESTSRGTKRRRENEGGTSDAASPSVPPTPTIPTTTHPNISAPTSASPAQSHAASTPAASPALQHQQRPPPKPTSAANSSMPWPMPTVAVNTPSPVVATTTVGQEQQRTSYYRPRPTESAPQKSAPGTQHATAHQYMFQPNGNASSGSRLAKENGK